MRIRPNALIVAIVILLAACAGATASPPDVNGPTPSIATAGNGSTLRVVFPKGAVDVCTWFVSSTETIEQDGKRVPYSPTHCWLIDDDDLQEIDDDWQWIEPNSGNWDVFARIYYSMPNGDVQMLETNHITVVH